MEVTEKLSHNEIPLQVLAWLQSEKHTEGYGAFFADGQVYLAAKMGERPTGGYAILLGEAQVIDTLVIVRVEFISPKPWDVVTQVISYPHTVIAIACPDKPPVTVQFMTTTNSVIAKVPVLYLGDSD